METTASFGYWIRRQRKALDLTQQALAERVGCSVAAIKKIESDERKPSRQIAERLADVLGVPEGQRGVFVEVARGLRPVGQLLLAHEPSGSTPIRYSPLPSGTVTFLYTDIEGSTKLAHQTRDAWEALRKRHHFILQTAIERHRGYVFQIVGDAVCAAFHTAGDALHAAMKSQVDLQAENWGETPIRVRMGIHTGKAEVQEDGLYQGYVTLSHVQRLLSAGHGGQVLLSFAAQELVQDELPEGVELRDMGERRLKDFDRLEHLFQLNIADLPSDFPPLNTLDAAHHNLPVQLTSFIGREREIAEVKQMLSNTRLLTLTGTGGTGKTRLSIQIANEVLDQYPAGVWMVELASILDPLLIPRTTAIAIGLRDEPQRPVIDMLCDYLREKRLLLILDNCEHLIEACAQLADTLLHACPQICILASSREALGIAGERTYPVPSLTLPDIQHLPSVESLSQYEAIKLFLDRATSAIPTFTLTNDNTSAIARICQRLDGIPLAIELAAGKIRALSVAQIAQRLDDRFHLLTGGSRAALPRHQTLQAAIEWSYNLLSPDEQSLFRYLSVFVSGWTLEAAESVCSDEDKTVKDTLRTEDILELLTQLVTKSLVMTEERNGEVRYYMLETIRQYASDKLQEATENEYLHDRHLAYFLQLAETAEPHLRRAEQIEWLNQLEAEYQNLRAALEWALSKESAEPSLRLCAALGMFWKIRTHFLEGSKWLKRALSKESQSPTVGEKSARVKALYQGAELAGEIGDIERMKTSAELGLALAREVSSKQDIAIARYYVGLTHYRRGEHSDAQSLMAQSLTEFNDPYWEANCYYNLSQSLARQGKLKWAEGTLKSLELARIAGERLNLAEALISHCHILYSSGQIDEARKSAQAADDFCRQIGSTKNYVSSFFAELALVDGDYQKARSYYMEIQENYGLLGEKNSRSVATAKLGLLAMEQGNLKQAQTYLEEALATAREIGNKAFIAEYLTELGTIFGLQGNLEKCKQNIRDGISLIKTKEIGTRQRILLVMINIINIQKPENSARILGAITIARKQGIYNTGPLLQHYYDRAETYAREHLSDTAFESPFAEGQKMSLDDALDLALRTVEEM